MEKDDYNAVDMLAGIAGVGLTSLAWDKTIGKSIAKIESEPLATVGKGLGFLATSVVVGYGAMLTSHQLRTMIGRSPDTGSKEISR